MVSVITGFVAHKKLQVSSKFQQSCSVNKRRKRVFAVQQVSSFKTVAVMQVGFSITVGEYLYEISEFIFKKDIKYGANVFEFQ